MYKQTIIQNIQSVIHITSAEASVAIDNTGIPVEHWTDAHVEDLIEQLAPAPLATTKAKLTKAPQQKAAAAMVPAAPKGEATPAPQCASTVQPTAIEVTALRQQLLAEAREMSTMLSPTEHTQVVMAMAQAMATTREAGYAAQGITPQSVFEAAIPTYSPTLSLIEGMRAYAAEHQPELDYDTVLAAYTGLFEQVANA